MALKEDVGFKCHQILTKISLSNKNWPGFGWGIYLLS